VYKQFKHRKNGDFTPILILFFTIVRTYKSFFCFIHQHKQRRKIKEKNDQIIQNLVLYILIKLFIYD